MSGSSGTISQDDKDHWFLKLVEKMMTPSKVNPVTLLKQGQGDILQDPGDEIRYLSVYFGSTVFFMFVYFGWRFLFETVLKQKTYLEKNEKDRRFQISCYSANTHHAIVAVYAIYNLTHPICDTYDGIFTWFKDEKCLVMQDKKHVYIAAITGGYLIYDGIVLFCIVKSYDSLGLQTLVHHIIGTTGLFIGVMAGYGAASIANLTCLSELSTIFLNYRSMYPREQQSDLIPSIHQICFFVCYTVLRMFLYPYGTYCLIKIQYYSWNYNSLMRRNFMFITIFEYIAMFLLNVYWYKLIIVGLLKMLGIMKSKPRKKTADEPKQD